MVESFTINYVHTVYSGDVVVPRIQGWIDMTKIHARIRVGGWERRRIPLVTAVSVGFEHEEDLLAFKLKFGHAY